MNLSRFKSPFQFRKYFIQLFFLSFIAVCTSVILTAFLINTTTSTKLKQKMLDANLNMLEHINIQLGNMMQSVERSALENSQKLVLESTYRKAGDLDYLKIWELNKQLDELKNATNDVYSIDLYLPGDRLVISTLTGYTVAEHYDSDLVVPSAVNMWKADQQQAPAPPVFTYEKSLPFFSDEPRGYLYIHLNRDTLSRMLHDANPDHQGELMIVGRSGMIVSSQDDRPAGSLISGDWLGKLKATPEDKGYFDDKNDDFLVTYMKSNNSGWYIVSKISRSELRTFQLRKTFTILLVCILSLMIGGIFVYFISKKLYSPMRNLLKENTSKPPANRVRSEWDWISDKLTQNESDLKKAFLLQLIYGHYVYENEQLLMDLFKRYQIKMNCPSVALIVKPEEYDHHEKFKQDDRRLVLTAVSSIADDILRQHYLQYFMLREHEDSALVFILLFSENMEKPQINDILRQIAESIVMSVKTYLKFPSAIGVGRVRHSLVQIHMSYKEALSALKYRTPQNNIIVYEQIYSDEHRFDYPFEIDSAIIHQLQYGNYDDVIREFQRFVHWAADRQYPLDHIVLISAILYNSIIAMLSRNFAKDHAVLSRFNGYDTIQNSKTALHIERFFQDELLPAVFDMIQQQQKTKAEHCIESALGLIRDNIDRDISLTSIAESVGLSAPYFSKIFKKYVGVSFVKYTTTAKIEKTKDLLLESTDSIEEISRKIGYTERTFRRVFKELTGSTPSQFRAAHKDI